MNNFGLAQCNENHLLNQTRDFARISACVHSFCWFFVRNIREPLALSFAAVDPLLILILLHVSGIIKLYSALFGLVSYNDLAGGFKCLFFHFYLGKMNPI